MTNIAETVFFHGNASSNQIFRFYAQLVVTVEGIIATILYCVIFAFLFIVRFEKGSGTYFVFLIVSSLHGFILSILIVFFDCLHIIRNGDFVVVALGFGTNFIPPDKMDIAMQTFTIIAAYSWELVPTASVLQLISLTKPNANLVRRLCLAYAWPATAIMFNYFYGAPYFIPTPAYRSVLSTNARDFYDIHEHERIYVNGFPFLPKAQNDDISAIDLALKFALPTYFVSYTLFIFNTLQIRKKLCVNGARLSKKTLRMQQQFFRTQLMQGVFPLTVLSVPFIIFITVLGLGYELNKFSVIFSFSIWFTPIVQAVVMLSYIKATLDKQMTGNTVYSMMKTSDALPKISISLPKESVSAKSSPISRKGSTFLQKRSTTLSLPN